MIFFKVLISRGKSDIPSLFHPYAGPWTALVGVETGILFDLFDLWLCFGKSILCSTCRQMLLMAGSSFHLGSRLKQKSRVGTRIPKHRLEIKHFHQPWQIEIFGNRKEPGWLESKKGGKWGWLRECLGNPSPFPSPRACRRLDCIVLLPCLRKVVSKVVYAPSLQYLNIFMPSFILTLRWEIAKLEEERRFSLIIFVITRMPWKKQLREKTCYTKPIHLAQVCCLPWWQTASAWRIAGQQSEYENHVILPCFYQSCLES